MSESLDLFPESNIRQVVSASRRTDMVATDPAQLAAILNAKASPEQTHTVVLWTKEPHNILNHAALFSQLKRYDQCFLHLSITGLGGTMLEPKVPAPDKVMSRLPELIDFVGDSNRICIRFDPIVHLTLTDGSYVNNLLFFEKLASNMNTHHIQNVTTSWVQLYSKVKKRLAQRGIVAHDLTRDQWQQESEWLRKVAEKHNLALRGCCVPGWPRSKCIDGELFNRLHPLNYKATTTGAAGQRKLCGCTKSVDIGWYTSCIHGCLYCYGNPKLYDENYQSEQR
jgi:DNA repair photolyase